MAKTVVKAETGSTQKTNTTNVSMGGKTVSVKTNTVQTKKKTPSTVKTNTSNPRSVYTQPVNNSTGYQAQRQQQQATGSAPINAGLQKDALVSKAKKSEPKKETPKRVTESNPYKKSYTAEDYDNMKASLMEQNEDPYYNALWANVDYKDLWSEEDKNFFDAQNQNLERLAEETQIAKGDVASQKKIEDTKGNNTISDVADFDENGKGTWKDFSKDLEKYDTELEELARKDEEYDRLLNSAGMSTMMPEKYEQLKRESEENKNLIETLQAERDAIQGKQDYQTALIERNNFEYLRENGTKDEYLQYAKYAGGYTNNTLDDIFLNVEASQFRKVAGLVTFTENVKQLYGEAESKRVSKTAEKLFSNGEVSQEEYNELIGYARDILDRNTTKPGESVGLALNDVANQLTQMQINGEDATKKLVVDVVGNIIDNSIGQLGPAMAFGRAGMYANTALMSFAEYAPTYQQDIADGFTHGQAMMDAAFQTGIEFIFETALGGERILHFAEGEIMPRTLGEYVVEGLKSGAAEMAEETGGWLMSPLASALATGTVPSIEDWNPEELKQAVTTAFLAGFLQAEMSADLSQFGTEAPLTQTDRMLDSFLTIKTDEGKQRVQELKNELDLMKPEASVRKNVYLSDGTKISERDYIDIVERAADRQLAAYDALSQVKGVEIVDINRVNAIESLAEDSKYSLKDCLEVARQRQIGSLMESLNAGQVIQTATQQMEKVVAERFIKQENERLAQIQQELDNENISAKAAEWDKLDDTAKANATIISKLTDTVGGTPVEFADLRTKDGEIVDGFYLDGKIIVNPNAKLGAISALVHEYTHGIESTQFYKALRTEIRALYGEDYQSAVDSIKENYSDIKELSQDEAERELTANTVQKLFGNKKFISRLVKYNTNMAYKLYTDIKSVSTFSTAAEEIAQSFMRGFAELNPDNVVGGLALQMSYIKNGEINEAQTKLFDKLKGQGRKFSFDKEALTKAQEQMEVMADLMNEHSSLLPNEVIGKVLLDDSSYGKSVENSTKCPRTLAYDQLTSYVSDQVGRPLTAVESFLVSQKLYNIAVDPQCLYCYVALDRKSYEEFVGKYVEQRDQAIEEYKKAGSPRIVENSFTQEYETLRNEWKDIQRELKALEDEPYSRERNKRIRELTKRKKSFSNDLEAVTMEYIAKFTQDNPIYKSFLKGRKSTANMIDRFKMWIKIYNEGGYFLTKNDVRTIESREEILEDKGEGWEQLEDMLDYAQAASWAKKSISYRAYFDDIRKLTQQTVNNLNKHYGLRWYSFNDYTPAYILENMQQFTDAAIKGLKGLAYTKDVDFAEIFAPTGVNINISMYATRLPDGTIGIDPLISAELERAIAIRNKYPNVGIVITATNDETVQWALDQEWSDVVIPFHIVRTGSDIAEYYKWTVYNQEQNDTVNDTELWKRYVASLNTDEKKVSKMIYPSEHQNDLGTYLRLCAERGLKPRFFSFLKGGDILLNENGKIDFSKLTDENIAKIAEQNYGYMKLVNETRQSEQDTEYLKPVFDMNAAEVSFQKFVDKGGYYGGWYKDGVDVRAEANEVANDIFAINEGRMRFEDIKYGEGFVDFEQYKNILKLRNQNALNKVHGKDVGTLKKKGQYSYVGNTGMINLENYIKDNPSSKYKEIFDNLQARWDKANDMMYTLDGDGKRVYSDDDIKKETGWYFDTVDNTLKGEFYDDGAINKLVKYIENTRGRGKNWEDPKYVKNDPTFGDILGEDSLFLKMYPQFNDIHLTVSTKASLSNNADGWWSNGNNQVFIAKRLYSDSKDYSTEKLKHNLAHEIQHFIQNKEGWKYEWNKKWRDRNAEQESEQAGFYQANPDLRDVDVNGKMIADGNNNGTDVSSGTEEGASETGEPSGSEVNTEEEGNLGEDNTGNGEDTAEGNGGEDSSQLTADEADDNLADNLDDDDLSEEAEDAAKILRGGPEKGKPSWDKVIYWIKHNLGDHLDAVEDLSRKSGNKEIISKANYAMSFRSFANDAILNGRYKLRTGEDIGQSLASIMNRIPEHLKEDFDYYMYHYRNLDTTSMRDRLGLEYMAQKFLNDNPLMGTDGKPMTAEALAKTIEKLEKTLSEEELKKIPLYQQFMKHSAPKYVFGTEKIGHKESEKFINEMEEKHPEFKEFAEQVWEYGRQDLQVLRDEGVISQEDYDKYLQETPHYVPIARNVDDKKFDKKLKLDPNSAIRRFKGSNIDLYSMEYALMSHTYNVYRSALINSLQKEIYKTLKPKKSETKTVSIDDLVNDDHLNVEKFKDGTFKMYAYFNGERRAIKISEELYNSLVPRTTDLPDIPTFGTISDFRRNLITSWNLLFSVTNHLKDIQDAAYNTKYLDNYYKNLFLAWDAIVHNKDVKKLYLRNGGGDNTFLTEIGKNETKIPVLDLIIKANDAVELAPRLAEFISSLEAGNSIEKAIYDAAEVTTNFKRGGRIAKYINRNGVAFFNASIQGFEKQVRNYKDAAEKGPLGVATYMARCAFISGIPLAILNGIAWRKDKDYEELSDYIKANYFIVWKTKDGRFIRIPKGRMMAFYQTIMTNGIKSMQGKMDLWEMLIEDAKSAADNVAPNSVTENFLAAPLIQAAQDKTWYGEKLIPQRLDNKPAAEQYDASTDKLSIWLGEKTGLSPYKINYVLDQYTGGIGDIGLPMITLQANNAIDNELLSGVAAPLIDKFMTDPVLKNQNVSEFYTLKDELEKLSNSKNANDEQKLSYKYLSNVASAMSDLYAKQREIQENTSLSNSVKYNQVRELKEQINALAREALNNYDMIDINSGYANVGGVEYHINSEGGWTKMDADALKKIDEYGLSDEQKGQYYSTYYDVQSARKSVKDKTPQGQSADYTQVTIDTIRNSKMDAKTKNAMLDSYYSGKFTDAVNEMSLNDEQKFNLKAACKTATGEKDDKGKTIANSKARAVAEAYDKLGLLDDVIKYIEDNDIEPSVMGLSKTVLNELLGGSSYSSSYSKTMSGKSSGGSKKSSKASKGGSSSGSVGTVSGKRQNIAAPAAKKTSPSSFVKAYSKTFSRNNAKPATGGSATSTCPKCGNRVPPGATRCPICGTKL